MKSEEPILPNPGDELAYRIAWLIAGYVRETLNRQEQVELDDWVTASMDNQRLFEELTDKKNLEQWLRWKESLPVAQVLERLKGQLTFIPEPRRPRLHAGRNLAVAASICGIILVSLLLFRSYTNHRLSQPTVILAKTDIAPGGNRATLTLADGTTRQLDSTSKGMLATQGGATVMKDDSDRLVYQTVTANPMAEPVFNILRVPRGGQFQLRLPDGTKVWLNAESYLKYPTTFNGKDRQVELSGEGYFEVAQDSHHPFIVRTENVETQVLGTSFNINTYSEKKTIQITLAQGAVKVILAVSSQKGQLLLPGQQAQVDRVGGEMKIVPANLVTTLAWKDGLFTFQNTPLEDVLAQISRWYNVNATDSTTDTNHFNASIPRDVPVSRLLHMLEQTKQVHFRIDPDKITATN
jgi:transmembrane sensor